MRLCFLDWTILLSSYDFVVSFGRWWTCSKLMCRFTYFLILKLEIVICKKVASSPCWSRFYSLLFNQNRFHWSRKEQRTGGYHSYLICILGRGGSPVLAPVCIRTTILVLKSSGIRQRRFPQLWVGIHFLSRLSCLALPCIPAMVAMCLHSSRTRSSAWQRARWSGPLRSYALCPTMQIPSED